MPPVTVGQNWSSMARTSTSGNRLRVSKGSRSAGGGSNRRFRRSVSNFSVFPMLRQEERERERESAQERHVHDLYALFYSTSGQSPAYPASGRRRRRGCLFLLLPPCPVRKHGSFDAPRIDKYLGLESPLLLVRLGIEVGRKRVVVMSPWRRSPRAQ